MSYLRWPVYVWSDGHRINLWARAGEDAEKQDVWPIPDWCLDEGWAGGLIMSERLWEELSLVRVAEMDQDGTLAKVAKRIASGRSTVRPGNFSAYPIYEALGLDPSREFRAKLRGSQHVKRHALNVNCPECGQPRKEKCVTASGNPRRTPHTRRVERRERHIERGIERMRVRAQNAEKDDR